MGTTESILHDADADASQSPEQQDQRLQRVRVRHRNLQRSSSRPGNVITLKGVVLGLTNSGKRTLLRRLEGKDPFVVVHDANDDEHDSPPLVIQVPYQPPPNVTVWDCIQLQVQLKPENEPCHFCVILVNPKHKPKSLRPYIAKIVTMLVQQAGYTEKNKPIPPHCRPLCLCVLLNFRDLISDTYDDCIQQKHVEHWVNEILEQHSVVREKLILQCGTTSLRNCFGLSSLHHFIYRCYLQIKKEEWEQRLEIVRIELDKSYPQVPTMTYEAFLKVLEQTKTDSEKPANGSSDNPYEGPRKHISEKEARKRDERKDRRIEEETNQSVRNNRQRVVVRKEKGQTRSIIMPKEYLDPNLALEAFFADDDDDEVVTPKTLSHHVQNVRDSSDDDDDDFFYDEKGQRHQHGGVDYSSSDEDEEESIESHNVVSQGTVAKARGLSVVDEESSADKSASSSSDDKATTEASKQINNKVEFTDASDQDNEIHMDNDDENGWGDDDDIDLDEEGNDVYESKNGENELKEDHQRVTPDTKEQTKKVEKDANDLNNHEGWKDDDLDLSETDKTPAEDLSSDYVDPTPESAEINENGAGEKDTLDRPKNSSTDETELSESSNVDEYADEQSSLVASETSATVVVSGSNDLEAVQEEEVLVMKPSATVSAKSDESDDDDFIVEEILPKSGLPKKSSDRKQPIPREEAPSISSTAFSLSTPGISAAALAAIAAAEQEAELMVQEAMNTPPLNPAKKPKKKKDLDAKKKKKKKKETHKDYD